MSTDFKGIFQGIEDTLVKESKVSRQVFDNHFLKFKNLDYKKMSDNDIYWIIVCVTFYSGMRAKTVTDKIDNIHNWFHDYKSVARYQMKELKLINEDKGLIHHHGKINACISNAKLFEEIINEFGSFRKYIESFGDISNKRNIEQLKGSLKEFSFLGEITVNHFLTDLGFNVIKPDRVLRRIFFRLGLINDEENIFHAIEIGRKFAEETKLPIRYIDIIFVTYGQVGAKAELGLNNGICLEKNPNCKICGVSTYCKFFKG
jgi:DNA-3-methyladenine glycosylase I